MSHSQSSFPRDIQVRSDIQGDLLIISGDATQLHQVIMNLCVNARDAMPDGGILNITASNFLIDENYALMHTEAKVGSYVAITVSDTGPVFLRIYRIEFSNRFSQQKNLAKEQDLAYQRLLQL